MLVLTRKPSQSILINDNQIEVKILEVKGKYVRIGIAAPKTVSIHRDEVYLQIQAAQQSETSDQQNGGNDNEVTV